MPSLRRSFSSPSVRSSPYPSSSAPLATRTRPNPRRSAASATTDRRVLADIEWWRVHDGQCDTDLQLHDDGLELDVPPGGTVTLSAGGGPLEPPPQTHASLDAVQFVYPDAFAALSVAPAVRHGRDSSVESTPELPMAPLETVQLGLPSLPSSPFGDPFLLPSSLMRPGARHPLFGLRSISAPGWARQGTFASDFADMGGDSFSLDQNLFQ